MSLRILIIIIFSSLGLSSLLYGAEKNVVITTLTDFAPYCFKKENSVEKAEEVIPPDSDSSQLQGYSWDVVRESFHEMGYTIKLLIAPWARGMYYVKKGKADVIFPAIKTREREKIFFYAKEVVDLTDIVVYVPANSSFEWKNGLESFNGLRISTVRGWAYGKKWEANSLIIKDPTDTILQGFMMLDKKRVAGVVGYETAFDYALKKEGIFRKYKKSPSLDSIADYLIGKKDNPHVVNIINDFDIGKRKIIRNGKLNKIRQKWQQQR